MRPDKKIKKKLYRTYNNRGDRYGDKYKVKRIKSNDFDENMPNRTAMSPSHRSSKTFKPLLKFLKSSVGKHWDKIYSEIVQRIPENILAENNPIEWYVSLHVIINEDKSIYDTRSHQIISLDGKHSKNFFRDCFYVHPVSKVLHRLKVKAKGPKLSNKEIGLKNAEIKKEKAQKVKEKKEKKRNESFENILRKKYGDNNGENFIG